MTHYQFRVEEGLIKESREFERSSGRLDIEWKWSTYKIHGSFDTREEANALLEKLKQRPTGYTHYRIHT